MKKYILFICLLLSTSQLVNAFAKTTYPLEYGPIDVVIPSCEKDRVTLDMCIDGIRKYGVNVRRIIVVSKNKLTENAEWVSEDQFPFSKLDIAKIICKDKEFMRSYIHDKRNRLGWILQQLLKLYAPLVIENISDNVLVLDSDTVFLRKVIFQNRDGSPNFAYEEYNHKPYYEHSNRLLPGLVRAKEKICGITHHMLYQKLIMKDLFNQIESYHKCPMWQAYCKCIDKEQIYLSGSAGYSVYFNFVLLRTDQYKLRNLKMVGTGDISSKGYFQSIGYHAASFHTYLR